LFGILVIGGNSGKRENWVEGIVVRGWSN